MKASLDHKCLHCGKKRGDHRAKTYNCPVGLKTRIGYIHYAKDQVFSPDPAWRPKQPTFTL